MPGEAARRIDWKSLTSPAWMILRTARRSPRHRHRPGHGRGLALVRPTSEQALDREGQVMGHCVGSGTLQFHGATMISGCGCSPTRETAMVADWSRRLSPSRSGPMARPDEIGSWTSLKASETLIVRFAIMAGHKTGLFSLPHPKRRDFLFTQGGIQCQHMKVKYVTSNTASEYPAQAEWIGRFLRWNAVSWQDSWTRCRRVADWSSR